MMSPSPLEKKMRKEIRQYKEQKANRDGDQATPALCEETFPEAAASAFPLLSAYVLLRRSLERNAPEVG